MKIICIGRNYADHAKEMNAAVPTEPVFFLKPDTSLLKEGSDFYYPEFTKDLHYECEVVVRIEKVGKNIAEKFAHKYYSSITLGIDFTARDLQQKCKEKGLPWDIAKGFNGSAPISEKFIPVQDFKDLQNINFNLSVDGTIRQQGNTSLMLFPFNYIIAYLSKFFTLKTGDLIFTGTPKGVAAVKPGNRLTGFIENEKMLDFEVK